MISADSSEAAPRGTGAKVHVFSPFSNFHGGTEQAALELARELRRHAGADVRLWRMSARYDRRCDIDGPVQRALPWNLPRGGTYIFMGAFWKQKRWMAMARPDRVRVVVNTNEPDSFRRSDATYRRLSKDVRYFFRCRLQRDLHGVDGDIHPSSIDLKRFYPAPAAASGADTEGPFRVGRISRDLLDKHHFLYDPEIYRTLAQEDYRFSIMGGTCLAPLLADQDKIELLPAGAIDAADFLRGLCSFFFRTGTFYDTFARVVFEAMACGLPVVCDRFGGYSEYIRHGHDGLLFDGQQQALELLRELRRNGELRRRLGAEARRTAEALFGDAAARKRISELLD